MSKTEEWLAEYHSTAAETLSHFNANHDPRNGQFAKGHSGSASNGSVPKKKGMSQQQFNRLGTAAALAAVAATKSYDSQKKTSEFLNGLMDIAEPDHEVIFKPSVRKIGAAAVSAALLTYGAYAASDLYKTYKRQNSKPQDKKR